MVLDNLRKYRIILASNSPRRKELLGGLGIDYEVKVLPGIDESYPDSLKGEEIPVYDGQPFCSYFEKHIRLLFND